MAYSVCSMVRGVPVLDSPAQHFPSVALKTSFGDEIVMFLPAELLFWSHSAAEVMIRPLSVCVCAPNADSIVIRQLELSCASPAAASHCFFQQIRLYVRP